MTRHDPDREFEGFPPPDGDDELTAVLNEAIDVDQGWQALLQHTSASPLQEECPGQADLLRELEPFSAAPCPSPHREQMTLSPHESPLPYGIDTALQELERLVGSMQMTAMEMWARSRKRYQVDAYTRRLRELVAQLREGLRKRTIEKETASRMLADSLELADAIAVMNEEPHSVLASQMAPEARAVESLLAVLGRLIMRLFDDTDVTDPCVPVRPGS